MVFATSAKVADDQGRAPLLGETKRRAYLGGPALWSSDASVAPEGAGDGSRRRCGAADAASELRPYDADAPRSWTTASVWAAGVATRLSMVLYGPLGLVVARLFHCERGFNGPSARSAAWRAYASDGGNQRLAADPAVGCFSNELLAFRTLLAPVGALCLVAVPWLAMRRAVGACAYASPTDHEKTLQRHEIEHVLGVDGGDAGALCDDRSYEVLGTIAADRAADRGATGRRDSDWDFAEVWLVAPYKRHAATREARMLLRKLGLLCCYAWLRGEHRAQGVAVLAVEAYFGLPQVIRRPFRDARSNEACIILELAALTNAVYAMMTAWGLRSAVVMDKEQSIALIAVNGLAAVLVLGVFCAAYRGGDALPRAATAVDRARSAHGATCLVDWVTVSRQARAAAVKASAWRPRCLAPTHVLERRMDDARRAWVEAKRRNCLLEGTVRESLDALVRAHQVCAETTMCVGGKWFAEDGDPFSRAASALKTRSEEKVLMKPRKRALLLKLLALRYFQQARDRKKGSAPLASRRTSPPRADGARTAAPRGRGRRRGAGGRRRGAGATPRRRSRASCTRTRQRPALGRTAGGDTCGDRPPPASPARADQVVPALNFSPSPRGDLGDVPEEGSYHEPDSSEEDLSPLVSPNAQTHGLLS
ncbi:hypothetical protein JL720_10099 [Aureococcus anophagefferens]|nr:hypothetical protein JL720_10099 [Aureococcus anophagefferens]